jgi:hypothetical protein
VPLGAAFGDEVMGGLWEGLKKSLPCSNPLYIGVSSDYGRDEGFFSMSCKEKGLIIWWFGLLFITLYTIFDVLNEIIKRCA